MMTLRILSTLTMATLTMATLSGCTTSNTLQPDSVYGAGWATAHADAANSDYSPVQGPRRVELAWERGFEGTINLGPTNDGARVYVTTSAAGCHLYVLDYATGETIWCSQEVNRMAVASSALLDSEGRIYIADNEAMYAFSPDGHVMWRTPIVGFPLSAQFTPSGRIIFTTHVGRLYVLDRADGRPVMEVVELSPGLGYDPSVDARACMRGTDQCPSANTLSIDSSGRIFFTYWPAGAAQAELRAMQYTDSPQPGVRLLWTNDTLPGGSASSPDISADETRVYVNDNVDSLHAIDAETGRSIWRFPIGYEPGGSQSTTPEGLIMPAGGGAAALMALRDAGGEAALMWRNEALQNRGIPTIAAGGVAYATIGNERFSNDLAIIDTATGAVLDRHRLPGRTLFTVGTTLDANGYVYVPTFNGRLFAFRPAN